MTGGWVKVTPSSNLDPGEYAVIEAAIGERRHEPLCLGFRCKPAGRSQFDGMETRAVTTKPVPDTPKELEKR